MISLCIILVNSFMLANWKALVDLQFVVQCAPPVCVAGAGVHTVKHFFNVQAFSYMVSNNDAETALYYTYFGVCLCCIPVGLSYYNKRRDTLAFFLPVGLLRGGVIS